MSHNILNYHTTKKYISHIHIYDNSNIRTTHNNISLIICRTCTQHAILYLFTQTTFHIIHYSNYVQRNSLPMLYSTKFITQTPFTEIHYYVQQNSLIKLCSTKFVIQTTFIKLITQATFNKIHYPSYIQHTSLLKLRSTQFIIKTMVNIIHYSNYVQHYSLLCSTKLNTHIMHNKIQYSSFVQ